MKKIFLLTLFCISVFHSSYSQVTNDECAGALTLTPSTTCTSISGTLTGATTSTLTTSCNGYADVFYKFVATAAAVDVTVVPSSALDAKVSIMSACGTPNYLACQDNAGTNGTEKAKVSALTIGQTYYIKVASYSSTLSAPTFTICVQNTTRPANDECSTAAALTPTTASNPVAGALTGSTKSLITTSCAGDLDVFYKFVATSASATFTVNPLTSFDPFISVFTSCGGSSLVCRDNAGTAVAESINLTNLVLGATYYLKVASREPGTGIIPDFTIAVQNQTPGTVPANDECAGATTIIQATTCTNTNSTIGGATTSTTTSSCSGYNDVFFKFVATSASADIMVIPGTGLNPVVSVFSACGGTSLYCNDNNYTGYSENVQTNGLVAGNTYYVKVASADFAPSSSTFSICVRSVTRPLNDECTTAQVLTPSTTCSAVSGTLLDAATSFTTSSCGGNYDVFYKFTATSTSVKITVTPTLASLDLIVGVFSGCGTSYISCNDNSNQNEAEISDIDGLTIGSIYYIKVQAYSSIPVNSTFNICVQNQTSQAPANDECTGAIALAASTSCSPISGTIFKATTSAVTTDCNGYYDVFYKFVANAPTAAVTATGSSNVDLKLSVFSTCGGNYLACEDATGYSGTETAQLTGLTIGTTYYIKASSWSASTATAASTFTICVNSTPVTVPVNDECTGAILLTHNSTCTPTTGTSLNATTSTITGSSCRTGNSDVFYKFVATSTTATVTVAASSGYDAVVSSHAACGAAYTSCADNAVSGSTEILYMTGLTIGNTYYIKVQQYGSPLPATPAFTICITNTPVTVPVNDECTGAISINTNPTCTPISGSLSGATTSSITNQCDNYFDVFYKFVATNATASITVTPNAQLDVSLSLYASCGASSALICRDVNYSGESETISISTLVPGNTYYLAVSDYGDVPAFNTFTVCIQSASTTTDTYETSALKTITLFPNPSQGVLNLENISEITQVECIDVTGTPVFVKEISANSLLDVSALSAGVYIVRLTINGVTENRRLVISK